MNAPFPTRWKLTLEYDGSGFSGWQKQAHPNTIQEILETAIHKFSGEAVALHTAGRTDAGVHARAQVAHFDLHKDSKPHTVRDAINFYLRPHPIMVLSAEAVPKSFHARFNATTRRYRYYVVNRPAPLALLRNRAWHIKRRLALAPMQEAAKLLIGKHDFSTFRAQFCQANSPIRTLEQLDISADGEMFVFETSARSFLYHQVRNMVGTLIMVGAEKWSVEDFRIAFESLDRSKGGPTAPSDGLFFWEVVYGENKESML